MLEIYINEISGQIEWVDISTIEACLESSDACPLEKSQAWSRQGGKVQTLD